MCVQETMTHMHTETQTHIHAHSKGASGEIKCKSERNREWDVSFHPSSGAALRL